jgi:hypothetical protein
VNFLPYAHSPTNPVVSSDGYIRLPLAALSRLSFIHLMSVPDSELLQELKTQSVAAQNAGFSEWVSDTTPEISVGWGWFLHKKSKRLFLAPEFIRSNVMLTDVHGYDLGKTTTSNLFSTWLADYDWQNAVLNELNIPMLQDC